MSTTFHTLSLPAGRIFVRRAGSPDAPTILLLHGFPSSSAQFQPLIDRLEDRYQLIAPDLLGFGFSETPTGPVTFDRLADAAEQTVDALRLERYATYLFDFGGPVGMRLAERRPDAVTGLIVQNANAYEAGIGEPLQGLAPFWADRASAQDAVRGMLLTPEATRNWYALGVADQTRLDPAAWTLDQALLEQPGRDAVALDLIHDHPSNVARYGAWQALLRERAWPTLIPWGRHDPFFVEAGAHAYLADVPHAQLRLLETGHFATATHTAEIATAIDAFMTTSVLAGA
jgi:pimeloyl-ACP methyl ester carboxylesterase